MKQASPTGIDPAQAKSAAAALFQAIEHLSPQSLELALAAGAAVDEPFPDNPRFTALSLACQKIGGTLTIDATDRALRCVKILLAAGANPDGSGSGCDAPVWIATLATHLPEAAKYDRKAQRLADLISALSAAGADLNLPGEDGLPPLHNCLDAENLPLARAMAKLGADIDRMDTQGLTIVHRLARDGGARALPLALSLGCDAGLRDMDGGSPLSSALAGEKPGHLSCARALIRLDCEVKGPEKTALRRGKWARILASEMAAHEARAIASALSPRARAPKSRSAARRL